MTSGRWACEVEGDMPKYPFLSDEWVDRGPPDLRRGRGVRWLWRPPRSSPVRVNLVITDAPFSDRPIDAHVDTSSGRVAISTGHLPSPDVTVSMGYGTARSLFVAGDVQAVMQAFLGGRVRVDGDLSKLLDPRSGIWPRCAQPGRAGSPAGRGRRQPRGGRGERRSWRRGRRRGPAAGRAATPPQPELGFPGRRRWPWRHVSRR